LFIFLESDNNYSLVPWRLFLKKQAFLTGDFSGRLPEGKKFFPAGPGVNAQSEKPESCLSGRGTGLWSSVSCCSSFGVDRVRQAKADLFLV
jgi:hypothetical protein